MPQPVTHVPEHLCTYVTSMHRGFTGEGLREGFTGEVYGQISPCEMRTHCLRAKMIHI